MSVGSFGLKSPISAFPYPVIDKYIMYSRHLKKFRVGGGLYSKVKIWIIPILLVSLATLTGEH